MSLRRALFPLWWTQFCGAFNDNLYKNALIIIFTFQAQSWGINQGGSWVNIIAALFILPFLLFSLMAGRVADRFNKTRLIRLLKTIEVALMLLGSLALLIHSLWGILSIIFLLGVHSTFFGPVKYAILPELVNSEELALANGWVELGTFMAIILGTNLSALLIPQGRVGEYLLVSTVLIVALIGLISSFNMRLTSVKDDSIQIGVNPFQGVVGHLLLASQTKGLWAAIIGNSWFWFFGAVYLTQLPNYCKEVLQSTPYLVTLFWTLLAFSVALGSLLSGRLLSTRCSTWLLPVALTGMSILSWPLSVLEGGSMNTVVMALIDVVFLGFFAGLYIVPMYVWIQRRTAIHQRAAILGLTNMLNALFMIIASLLILFGLSMGLSISQLFGIVGGINVLFLLILVIFARPLLLQVKERDLW
ncbi:MFS transporter [Ferrovum sp. PN-J185]|uniref:MFS transporter n=1 Tax=Ferrovum sp. PN-J185 TaxID=1356306 RepID=UPI00079B935F|nr:MFS transporter [Ferrovum sp. PN-J185]KXW56141.1 lysophospholipid transporter LplT [Ferrovum sp. PN-J185]MCC6067797.1 MFS transporter [Ferrovum sp. PN-J185]